MNHTKRQCLVVLLLVVVIVVLLSPAIAFAGNRGDSDDDTSYAGIGIVVGLFVIGGWVYLRRGDGTTDRVGKANDPGIAKKIANACKSGKSR